MRLQKITTYYPGYLNRFYATHPEFDTRPYALQHSQLMAECFGWSDFWATALEKLGYETSELVSNVEPMQKRWASENDVSYNESNWLLEITAAQIKAFRPDVLLVTDYNTFSANFLRQLKAECPSLRLTLGWCGAPYNDPSVFREYDIVLSSVPELVEHFREGGHVCHHINHAFEPRILEKIDTESPPTVNFSFIGSIVKRDKYHIQREKLLLDLLTQVDLQIWANVAQYSWRQRSGTALRQLIYDAAYDAERAGVARELLTSVPLIKKAARWESRPGLPASINKRIARRARPPIYGLEMYQQLRNSKIALNTHIDISSRYASNMRLYEATGVGTCLLTEWYANLHELFEPDAEVVTYRNSEECIEKVRYLLDHEEERREISAAGQRRTLRDHTFTRRAEQLSHIIESQLSQSAVRG